MRLASANGVGLVEREAFRLFRLRKRIRQLFKYRSGMDKTVLFIVGCQRSGTSMIHHLFRLDWDTVTYDEISPLSSDDPIEGLRLNPLPEVQARILRDRAPLVVCKPLVESQKLDVLLDLFPATHAIWMYRDFRAVVLSNLKFFGPDTGHRDLAPIVAGDETNWRAEKLAAADRDIILDIYSPELDPRIRLCRYGDLVARPAVVMARAYDFLGKPYPGDRIVEDVFSGSRGRGRDLDLSPPVRDLCEGMLSRLENHTAALRPSD